MRAVFVVGTALVLFGRAAYVQEEKPSDGDRLQSLRTLKRPQVVTQDDHLVSLAFSPKGHWLAAGHSLDTNQLWDTLTWKEQPPVSDENGSVDAVVFSPNGKRLVFADAAGILIWNPKTRQKIRSLDFNDDAVEVNCAAFSPDGKLLAAGSGTSDSDTAIDVKVWNTTTWRIVYQLKAHEHAVTGVCFSPDGRTLIIGGGSGKIKLMNTSTWRVVRAIALSDGIASLALSPDGKRLAIGDFSGKVILWDTTTWRKVRILNIRIKDAKYAMVETVIFSPNGRYLAAACDRGVMLWKSTDGEAVHLFADASHAAAFSPNSRLLAVGNQAGAAKIWSLPTR